MAGLEMLRNGGAIAGIGGYSFRTHASKSARLSFRPRPPLLDADQVRARPLFFNSVWVRWRTWRRPASGR